MFLGETKSFPLTGRLFLPRRRRGRRGRPLDVLPADELKVVQQRPLEAEAGRAGLVGAGERLQGAVAGVAVGVATAKADSHMNISLNTLWISRPSFRWSKRRAHNVAETETKYKLATDS